jgi:hypothetical protein
LASSFTFSACAAATVESSSRAVATVFFNINSSSLWCVTNYTRTIADRCYNHVTARETIGKIAGFGAGAPGNVRPS